MESPNENVFSLMPHICLLSFRSTGGSTGTQWLSSGTLWSVSTLACQRTRSNVATRTASWATFSPRTTTTWTSSSSKGKKNGDILKWSPSTDCSDYHWIQRNTSSHFCVCDSFLQLIFEITQLLKLFFFSPPVSVWFPSWLSWGRWWTGFGPTPLCRFPTGFVLKTSMPTYLFSSAGGSLRK